jgi:hypothetical protein
LLTEGVGSIHQLFQDICGVSQVVVTVSKVYFASYNSKIKFIVDPRLTDASVEKFLKEKIPLASILASQQ